MARCRGWIIVIIIFVWTLVIELCGVIVIVDIIVIINCK